MFTVGGSSSPATLTAADGAAGDAFGSSVGISASNIVVGAPERANLTGTAYVFSLGANSWVQQQEIVPMDSAAGDSFATAVAISGSTLAFGAYTKGNGVAYVYTPQVIVAAPALGKMTPLLAGLLLVVALWLKERRTASTRHATRA